MSVINRVEIANFLNLDNIGPAQQNWQPDYVHVLMNFRGESTAVVATNGMGKTTINRAIYALLTRDQGFSQHVKSVAAPSRIGAYSHIRMEVLFRDKEVGSLLGRMGADIPGEPYVFGLYGNSDGDMVYYTYQGVLEDCPAAQRNGNRVQITANSNFRATLRNRPSLVHNPTREEWSVQIGRHFDLAILEQQVSYQKVGGGDSAEDFFKVKQKRSNGQVDDYDSAFFYEFIVPEILANAMHSEDHDNSESRFEETILRSATPVIAADLKGERLKAALEHDRETFQVIEKVNDHLTQFLDERRRLDQYIDDLAGEVGFILDVTEHHPLPGIPPVLAGRGEQTNLAANGLVIVDGEWLVPDSLLAVMFCAEPKHVNELAQTKAVANQKARQPIDIPSDLGSRAEREQGGGHARKAYTLANALHLADYRTSFAEGWDKDKVKRALNLGHAYRSQEGDTNPFRQRLRNIDAELGSIANERKEVDEICSGAEAAWRDLGDRITSLQADEYALVEIRASGLFTTAELNDLGALGASSEQGLQLATRRREVHEQHHIALGHGRSAYATAVASYPDTAPADALKRLQADVNATRETSHEAETIRTAAEARTREANDARIDIERSFEIRQTEKLELDALLASVSRFEALFGSENPNGLEEKVIVEHEKAITRNSQLDAQERNLKAERGNLLDLVPSWQEFREAFLDESSPVGLEGRLVQSLTEAKARRHDLRLLIEQAAAMTANLKSGQAAVAAITDAGETISIGFEASLRVERDNLTPALTDAERNLAVAEKDSILLTRFETQFPGQVPATVRLRRQQELPPIAALHNDATRRRGDILRQLDELKRSATAAGCIASEILNAIGGQPARVFEVVNQTLPQGNPRREAVLMHFSHVLHAPVVSGQHDARVVLERLEEAGLESPVFLRTFVEQMCGSIDIHVQDGMATATLAGMRTLQVEGLLDPHHIEKLRERLKASLANADAELVRLTKELSDLAEESETSQFVRDACSADERGFTLRKGAMAEELATLRDHFVHINRLITEPLLGTVREAEQYLKAGGDTALATQEENHANLAGELTFLIEDTIPLLEKQHTYIPVVRRALQFHDSGGTERLDTITKELMHLSSSRDELARQMPLLAERRNATPDIRNALHFQKRGGRNALNDLAQSLIILERDRDTSRTLADRCGHETREARATEDRLKSASHQAELLLEKHRPILEDAGHYLAEGGLEFDTDYENEKERLVEEEEKFRSRCRFRFEAAQRAAEAEANRGTAAELAERRKEYQEKVDASRIRITKLDALAHQRHKEHEATKSRMIRMDGVASILLDRRRQARQAAADAELTAERINAAPVTDTLYRAKASANRVREAVALGDETVESIADEIEALAEDTSQFSLLSRISDIKATISRKEKNWNDYHRSLSAMRANSKLALSENNRAVLAEAEQSSGIHRVIELMKIFERHLVESTARYEAAAADLDAEKKRLATSLNAFTLQAKDNFSLLRSCLRPSNSGDAGFEIQASIIERAEIMMAVEHVIKVLQINAETRTKHAEQGITMESQRDYDERMRREIRGIFYRTVFTGVGDGNSETRSPRIFIHHPHIGGGARKRLDKRISTGQRNALGLLFMTKMADFAISRDERSDLAQTGRRNAAIKKTRVVMIDGLFSNVTNKALIRESLDAMRHLRGKFQLIGWVHNEAYENDPEIFPGYLALRRIGANNGFVVVDDETASGVALQAGNVDLIEMHVDPVPSPAQ
jgi:hypothetical protein